MGAANIADGGVKEKMGGEVQEAAVELDIGTKAGQNDAFEAVEIGDGFTFPLSDGFFPGCLSGRGDRSCILN